MIARRVAKEENVNVICTHRRPLLDAAVVLALACWGTGNVALPAEPEAAKGKAAEAAPQAAPPEAPGAAAAKHDALGNTEQVVSIGRSSSNSLSKNRKVWHPSRPFCIKEKQSLKNYLDGLALRVPKMSK